MFLTLAFFLTTLALSVVPEEGVGSNSQGLLPCPKAGDGRLKFMWGDALLDEQCLGPQGMKYPSEAVASIVSQSLNRTLQAERRQRLKRAPLELESGEGWGSALLHGYLSANGRAERRNMAPGKGAVVQDRLRRVLCSPDGDNEPVDDRLCSSEFNTTAPMFGVSMTSGETVAIVQKFPDLLQQIVYERCTGKECRLLRGSCQQTFVPYLLLTVPLGPVTLTGQDYVLVESGCVCKPQTASPEPEEL